MHKFEWAFTVKWLSKEKKQTNESLWLMVVFILLEADILNSIEWSVNTYLNPQK